MLDTYPLQDQEEKEYSSLIVQALSRAVRLVKLLCHNDVICIVPDTGHVSKVTAGDKYNGRGKWRQWLGSSSKTSTLIF